MNLWDVIFPRSCFHCQTTIKNHLFCSDCLQQLTLIPREGRCLKCFEEISLRKGICNSCRKLAHPFKELAACFEDFGPAKTLLHAFENKHQFLCAKDVAAFITMQIYALYWPIPDVIIPLPQHFTKNTQKIVKELSHFLHCPSKSILRKRWELIPQFSLKKKCNIYRQRVLLVATTMHSRDCLRSAAKVLEEGSPLEIYGMAFCII